VENVTHGDAADYCNFLSVQNGLPPCYSCVLNEALKVKECNLVSDFQREKQYLCSGYRLPTEAEWEYAYRAWTRGALYQGNFQSCDEDPAVDEIGWYKKNSRNMPHPVGEKPLPANENDKKAGPNPWGLLDMAGNVAEWCQDWYIAYFNNTEAINPVDSYSSSSTGSSSLKVTRGGSYLDPASALRASARGYKAHISMPDGVGFRCVRTIPSKSWVLDSITLPTSEDEYSLLTDKAGPTKNSLGTLMVLLTKYASSYYNYQGVITSGVNEGSLLQLFELFFNKDYNATAEVEVVAVVNEGSDHDKNGNYFSGSKQLGIVNNTGYPTYFNGSMKTDPQTGEKTLSLNNPANQKVTVALTINTHQPTRYFKVSRAQIKASIGESAGISRINGVVTFGLAEEDLDYGFTAMLAEIFNELLEIPALPTQYMAVISYLLDTEDPRGVITASEVKREVLAKSLIPASIDMNNDGKKDGYTFGYKFSAISCKINRDLEWQTNK
jgi:hypothetical protein